MTGATAASAAAATASQADATTINLLNNFISAFTGNHLNADLTGDGQPDITLTGAKYFYSGSRSTQYGFHYPRWSAAVNINGVYAKGYDNGDYPFRYERLGLQYTFGILYVPPPLTGKIPVSFTDSNINGGRLTNGFLEVTVTVSEVSLDSFTFSTPDQGSSLALLAMGASGVLALRRWRAAQKSS